MTDSAEEWRDEQRAVYSSGDSEFLARQQESQARRLVAAAAVGAGEAVLDIGAGTGNAAIEAARQGGLVTAIDLTPRQVELGQARTRAEGVGCTWHVADAEHLPVADGSVDVVVSNFGIVYAADPAAAAREASRVLRAGGRILLTSYPLDSFNGQALRLVDSYLGKQPPVDLTDWARQDRLEEWFAPRSATVSTHVERTPEFASVAAFWEAVQVVPIARHLSETLTAERFSTFGEELCTLRTRYAELASDGRIVGLNTYVIAEIR